MVATGRVGPSSGDEIIGRAFWRFGPTAVALWGPEAATHHFPGDGSMQPGLIGAFDAEGSSRDGVQVSSGSNNSQRLLPIASCSGFVQAMSTAEAQDGQSCSALHPCVTTKACQERADVLMAGDAPLALIRRQQTLLVIQGQGMDCTASITPLRRPSIRPCRSPSLPRDGETNQDAAVAALSLLLWIKCHQLTVEPGRLG